jgi:hypothetical protein
MSAGNPYNYPNLSCVVDLLDNDLDYVKSFQIGMGDFIECDFAWGKNGCQDFSLLFSSYQNISKTQIVKIRLEGTIFFSGIIREISEYADVNGNYVYAGYGLFDYLEKGNTTQKTFLRTSIYDIIEWFIDAVIAKGKPIVKNMTKVDGVLDTYLIDVLAFQNITIDKAFDQLRKIANGIDGDDYIYGIDEDREVFFTARSTTIQKTLSVGAVGDNGIAEYRPVDIKEEVENVYTIGINSLFYDDDTTGGGDIDEAVYTPIISNNNIDDFIEGEIYDFIRNGLQAKITWKIEDESPQFLIGDGVLRIISGNNEDELLINTVKYKITGNEKIRDIKLGGIEVPETENAFLLSKVKKADIRIDALRASSTIVNQQIRSLATKQNYVFAESFDTEDSMANWTDYDGGGEITILNSASSIMGGSYAVFGNNGGNDQLWLISNYRIPFNPDVMYRIRVYAKRTAGSGTVYLGVAGFDKDKALCDINGNANYTNQHYFAASNKNPGAGTLYTGYFRGNNAVAGGEHTSIFSPGYMQTNVKYFSPLLAVNCTDQTGKTEVFYFTIEVLPDTELNLLGNFGADDITAGGLLTGDGADLGDGGIVNTGALEDVTTIDASGLLTCDGANLSSGGIINAGSIAGVTSFVATGKVEGGLLSGPKEVTIRIRDNGWWNENDLFDYLYPFFAAIGDIIMLTGTASVDWDQLGLGQKASDITDARLIAANTIRIFGSYTSDLLAYNNETIDCVNGNSDNVMRYINIRG